MSGQSCLVNYSIGRDLEVEVWGLFGEELKVEI
jgi:hypothetical protein